MPEPTTYPCQCYFCGDARSNARAMLGAMLRAHATNERTDGTHEPSPIPSPTDADVASIDAREIRCWIQRSERIRSLRSVTFADLDGHEWVLRDEVLDILDGEYDA